MRTQNEKLGHWFRNIAQKRICQLIVNAARQSLYSEPRNTTKIADQYGFTETVGTIEN